MRYRQLVVPSAEYAAALALREVVLRAPLGIGFSEADRENDRWARHFGAFAEGRLVGCVLGIPEPDGVRIRQLVVAEGLRRQGIGAGLMAALEEFFATEGVSLFWSNARLEAIPFYRRLGYVPLGEPFAELGIPHQRMERHLSAAAG